MAQEQGMKPIDMTVLVRLATFLLEAHGMAGLEMFLTVRDEFIRMNSELSSLRSQLSRGPAIAIVGRGPEGVVFGPLVVLPGDTLNMTTTLEFSGWEAPKEEKTVGPKSEEKGWGFRGPNGSEGSEAWEFLDGPNQGQNRGGGQ